VTIGWDGFGLSEEIWAMLVIIVAAIITILIFNNILYTGYMILILLA